MVYKSLCDKRGSSDIVRMTPLLQDNEFCIYIITTLKRNLLTRQGCVQRSFRAASGIVAMPFAARAHSVSIQWSGRVLQSCGCNGPFHGNQFYFI